MLREYSNVITLSPLCGDTTPPPRAERRTRKRLRRGVFSLTLPPHLTLAQAQAIRDSIAELLAEYCRYTGDGEFALILHTHPEHHVQGTFRFGGKRDAAALSEIIGCNADAIRPIGSAPLAFARSVNYLRHDGEYPDTDIVANFDWRSEVATLPVDRPPSLRAVTDRVLAGELTPDDVAERWPHIYLTHRRRLDDAYDLGNRQRTRRERERLDAWLASPEHAAEQRRKAAERHAAAEAEAAEQAERERREAEAAEQAEHERREAAEQARRKAEQVRLDAERERREAEAAERARLDAEWAADRPRWYQAIAAIKADVYGDAAARTRGLTEFFGGDEPTVQRIAQAFGGVDDLDATVREFRDEIIGTRPRTADDWEQATVQNYKQAFWDVQEHKRRALRWPDLYEFVEPELLTFDPPLQQVIDAITVDSDIVDSPSADVIDPLCREGVAAAIESGALEAETVDGALLVDFGAFDHWVDEEGWGGNWDEICRLAEDFGIKLKAVPKQEEYDNDND